MNENYADINAETIDRWVEEGWEWGRPIDHAAFERARWGEWDVYLTPTKKVPHDWLGDLHGKRCWASPPAGDNRCRSLPPLARSVRCWTIRPGSWRASAWSPSGRATLSVSYART